MTKHSCSLQVEIWRGFDREPAGATIFRVGWVQKKKIFDLINSGQNHRPAFLALTKNLNSHGTTADQAD